jgi:ADP-ribose pyrophosphatase YjhB (NUDIX family)
LESLQCDLHKLIADVAVFADGRVLLIRYVDANKYDHEPGWFLPDDLLAHLEHPDAGATRILREQIGFTGAEPRLSQIESFRGRDRSWHLVFHYRLDLTERPAITPSNDVAAIEWFRLDALPARSSVAHHGWAVDTIEAILARG